VSPEEKVIELKALADPLLKEIFSLVKGEADKAPLATELARRMAIYASRGDQAGMGLVRGRAAAMLQESKLEAEAAFGRMLEVAGNFLMDVAETVLPRFIKSLEEKIS